MDTTYTTCTPAIGLTSGTSVRGSAAFVATQHSAWTAPNVMTQGTALSFAGTSAAAAPALVAAVGARSTDLPGSPPRSAPV